MSNIILETDRLSLREMCQSDFNPLCTMLQDPPVMYAYEHAFDDEEAHAWLDRQIRRYAEDGFGLWAVILKETNQMIGQCGITIQDCKGKDVLEVGYLFQKKVWHCGYAIEAAISCKEYAFHTLHADEVFSIIRDTNTASQKVALKNGMRERGELIKQYYNMDMRHIIFSVKNGD